MVSGDENMAIAQGEDKRKLLLEMKETIKAMKIERNFLKNQLADLKNELDLFKVQEKAKLKILNAEMSEATFRFTVPNISSAATGMIYSPDIYLRGLPWKLGVTQYSSDGSNEKWLAVYLFCNAESKSDSWSCRTKIELRLISYQLEGKPLCKSQSDYYKLLSRKMTNWGWNEMIEWDEMMNPEKGYMKDDNITVEAVLSALPPYGVW